MWYGYSKITSNWETNGFRVLKVQGLAAIMIITYFVIINIIAHQKFSIIFSEFNKDLVWSLWKFILIHSSSNKESILTTGNLLVLVVSVFSKLEIHCLESRAYHLVMVSDYFTAATVTWLSRIDKKDSCTDSDNATSQPNIAAGS